MVNVPIVSKLYPAGHGGVSAEGPKKYEQKIRAALEGSCRLDLRFDAGRFREILKGRGLPEEVIDAVVGSVGITSDEFYTTPSWPL